MAEPALVDRPAHAAPRGERAVHAAARCRFVTAASLFDGHDASINIMRRILQSAGAEVIHLGHNRSVEEIVVAALDEDAHAIAVSSYQGGHVEYFKYMVDMLRERGGSAVRVFGGGGGVIIPEEMRELHAHGVARVYSPEDGRAMGLRGMIDDMIARCGPDSRRAAPRDLDPLAAGDRGTLARAITAIEDGSLDPSLLASIRERSASLASPPVVGITGTGGSGKSSLTDELVRRLRLDRRDSLRIAVLAVDPSRRKTGGALLGDRIRMNAIGHPDVYMRSLATRVSGSEVPAAFADIVAATRIAGFDIVIVETSGIGQGDAGVVPYVDVPVYVMTPEFGAASQLEKIDMLDFAALVAINKFDRRGAEDALRDVSKQVQRNREAFSTPAAGDARPRHYRLAVQRRRGDRALPPPGGDPERARARRVGRGRPPGARRARLLAHPGHRARPGAPAISPRSPRPCANTTPASSARPRSRASASTFARRAVSCGAPGSPTSAPSPGSKMHATTAARPRRPGS